MKRILILALSMAVYAAVPAWAQISIETPAREALLVDVTSNTVLLNKNGQERMPPSSMSKLMTMYVAFSALRDGKLTMEQTVPVSEHAWKQEGSRMFIDPTMQVKVEDLIRGVIIQSGNDACVALAEAVSGSETAFAELMNATAQKLGMANSHFMNATGLPHPEHYMTAHDLVLLAQHLIRDFPEHYKYYSEKEFIFNKIKQGNRNPLLYKNIGADGLKTGHAEAAGYGITASAIQNGRRLILVVNGLKDMQQRADESFRLLEWGFREFGSYALLKSGDELVQADVWLGQTQKVSLAAADDITVTLPRAARNQLSVKLEYQQPLQAPITKGQQMGVIKINAPGMAEIQKPLLAVTDMPKLGWFSAMVAKTKYQLGGSQ
jgi:serine-type D-Ala-D-Ala carboxypeptidase (penicillin-binding protein 5/6)